ncbi:MAG: hypothetical protein AABY84_00610 [Candidatus Firestonebacteria bacterium]
MMKKTTFALYFGNRGVFPAKFIAEARQEMARVLSEMGYDYIMLDETVTKYGAVETLREGEIYSDFLRKNYGKFGGVILSLPNFGDETGAVVALKNAGVPILIQAYPDVLDKMGPADRRDAFCGKFSIQDVFVQYGIKFTTLLPHTVSPSTMIFKKHIDYFDRVCRVVNGMKHLTIGAIGARTTAFKTVRIDELTLQKNNITVETYDLSDIFKKVQNINVSSTEYKEKIENFKNYANWNSVPENAFSKIIKLGVVLDNVIKENKLDALALRCWIELQEQLGISACILLSEYNNRLIPAACEVDIGSAVMMYALQQASGESAACLDWNNNYEDNENKCILFHCGPVPQNMMKEKGIVTDNLIIAGSYGPGVSFGCNIGRIKSGPFTYSNLLTSDGKIKFYVGEGKFTDDMIPENFFGCAGVAEIADLQKVMLKIGKQGYRHHTSITSEYISAPLIEAFVNYLGFELTSLD